MSVLIWSTRPTAQKLVAPSHNPPTIASVHLSQRTRWMRPVLRLKKNAAAKLINTIVIKGVASPNRNQAISRDPERQLGLD
jgi:hypothetical protein